MKKAFVILASGILIISSVTIISCGGGNKPDAEAKTDTPAAAAPVVPQEDPAIKEGLALIGQSDCLTCHKLNAAGIGPAYAAVAEKYAGNANAVDSLALKVIKGGAGVWGATAMTPHPNLSEADAKKMITYVLSVKAE